MADPLDDNARLAYAELNLIRMSDKRMRRLFREAAPSDVGSIIYDLNGEKLLQRITLEKAGGPVGYLDVALHGALGNPLQRVSFGLPWDEAKILEAANARAAEWSIVDFDQVRFVVYDFPKVGVQFLRDSEELLLIDWATLSRVRREEVDVFGERLRFEQWSLLDEMRFSSRRRSEDRFVDLLRTLRTLAEEEGRERWSLTDRLSEVVTREYLRFSKKQPSHSLCFEMRPQEEEELCVAACAEMMLDFYRDEYTQQEIATALGLGATGLSCARHEFEIVEVLEALAGHGFLAWLNACPHSFGREVKKEIRENRPLILIGGSHARVIVGYIEINLPGGKFPALGFSLYNPWPPGKGEIEYWEAFDPSRYRLLYGTERKKE